MDELSILRKMAKAALGAQEFKAKYDSAMREWYRSNPFAAERRKDKILNKRSKIIAPLYEEYKTHQKMFDGYLFMWSKYKPTPQNKGGEK